MVTTESCDRRKVRHGSMVDEDKTSYRNCISSVACLAYELCSIKQWAIFSIFDITTNPSTTCSPLYPPFGPLHFPESPPLITTIRPEHLQLSRSFDANGYEANHYKGGQD